MKKIILLSFFVAIYWCNIQAQTTSVTSEVNAWKTAYQLNDTQVSEVEIITARKYRNLSEIQSLETSEPLTYKKKRQAILQQSKQQVARLMNSEQLAVFEANEVARKSQIRAQVAEMTKQQADKAEIAKLLEELNH